MSCYEWEEGTITIPKAQFSKLFKAFLKGYNENQERELSLLKSFQKDILARGKGKRKFCFKGGADELVYASGSKYTSSMVYKLFPAMETKPKTPTRKMVNFENTKTKIFNIGWGDAEIAFNKEKHLVHWGVQENNHACDSAHETHEAQLFFRLLDGIEWKRNTGGEIVGNDEYNRDNTYAGGGSNYVKHTFGKK